MQPGADRGTVMPSCSHPEFAFVAMSAADTLYEQDFHAWLETGLAREVLPRTCPFGEEEALDAEYLPDADQGRGWQ